MGKKKQGGEAKGPAGAASAPAPSGSAGAEIDALFGSVKKRRQDKDKDKEKEEEEEEEEEEERGKRRKTKGSSSSSSAVDSLPYGVLKSNIVQIINPEAPVERIDPETGFKVYKAHLLKVGEGGGTPDCPFDCDCCF